MFTGEPLPVEKSVNDKVTGGTVNGSGSFVMRAERVGSDTLLGQIVNMVAEAQRSRAPIQGLADKVAGIFVPAVLAVSVLTFIAWMWIGPEPKLAHAIVNAVAKGDEALAERLLFEHVINGRERLHRVLHETPATSVRAGRKVTA